MRPKKTYSIHAAKTSLSKLVDYAKAGEDVVIARGKIPVVRLVPVNAPAPRRRFGAMRGRARTSQAFFQPLPSKELEHSEG